mmetsp:Transcript_25829/g.25106  ORF Transcript_25829/g.25106 Transcript_25829/m.25106 type:complete len:238 (-) Transcript_25829:135-848(-)
MLQTRLLIPAKSMYNFKYHIATFGVGVVFLLVQFLSGGVGYSIFETCSILAGSKYDMFQSTFFVYGTFYCWLSVAVSLNSYRQESNNSLKAVYIQHFLMIASYSLTWTFLEGTDMASFFFQIQVGNLNHTYLEFCRYCIVLPGILTSLIIVFADPYIYRKLLNSSSRSSSRHSLDSPSFLISDNFDKEVSYMRIARTLIKTSSTLTLLPNQTSDFLQDCSPRPQKPIYTYLYEEQSI